MRRLKLNISKLTYEQNSLLRGRIFIKSLRGTFKKRARMWALYRRLEKLVTSGYYPNTVYGVSKWT